MKEKEKKTKKKNPADSTGTGLFVFSKMAPRKVKPQGKRNNIKIKSKVTNQKRGSKLIKKTKKEEKPIDNLKWLNKFGAEGSVKKSEAVPQWITTSSYKHNLTRSTSEDNLSDYDYPDVDEKYSVSDASEECNCSNSKYADHNKGGILKRKISSSNSLITNYIKSGMDQVASFIVESAIRFGEKHGVVIPDKNTPNVYEITPPDKRFQEKFKKIRFKIPDRALAYEDAKKLMWRSNKSNENINRRAQTPMPERKPNHLSRSPSWESTPDSLDEILPILEKLKDEGDIVTSDLDLDKLANASDSECHIRNRSREREKLRERFRKRRKRFKSLGPISDKNSEEGEYTAEKRRWKKFRRDSLELGRQRLRASTNPRKQESMSPSSY